MFSKIKNWIIGIGSAIIAFLFLLLGIKNRKIDKLKTENKVKDVVIKEVNISKDAEKEHFSKLLSKTEELAETIEEVKDGKKDYNDIINDWNDHS